LQPPRSPWGSTPRCSPTRRPRQSRSHTTRTATVAPATVTRFAQPTAEQGAAAGSNGPRLQAGRKPDPFQCEHQCGFTGSYRVVANHEAVCSRNPKVAAQPAVPRGWSAKAHAVPKPAGPATCWRRVDAHDLDVLPPADLPAAEPVSVTTRSL
jgi:hypothetical protein